MADRGQEIIFTNFHSHNGFEMEISDTDAFISTLFVQIGQRIWLVRHHLVILVSEHDRWCVAGSFGVLQFCSVVLA